jgi:hypothetical protein
MKSHFHLLDFLEACCFSGEMEDDPPSKTKNKTRLGKN